MAKQKRKRKKPNAALQAPQKRHRYRVGLLMTGFVLVYVGIAGKLIWLQTDSDVRLSEEERAHVGMKAIERPRGEIVDTQNRVLAADRKVPTLVADPGTVEHAEALARYLAPRLGLNVSEVEQQLKRKRPDGRPMRMVRLKRHLSQDDLSRLGPLEDSPEPGAVWFEEEQVRFYPEGDLASHIVGFVNLEGMGSAGIEQTQNASLASKSGRRVSRVTGSRRIIGYKTISYEAPSGGDRVELTIHSAIQQKLESAIDKALIDKNAPRGMGIVMDPNTGAVLALAVRPAFDPNRFREQSPEDFTNRALSDVFEPGSSFKIVTAAAALEHGLVGMDTPIDCMGGEFNPYGHRIKDTHPLGIAPFYETFAQSSNIAIIKVADLLGPERLESWIRKFGFGSKTNIGLPGESSGIFRPVSRWSKLSMGSLPMGQEIAVTLPQLARSFAVIANGGNLVDPYLVQRIVSEEGRVEFSHEPKPGERVISEDTAKKMRDLCHRVVTSEHGTGELAAIPEYRVGGKTGTAQIAKPNGGGYYQNKYTTVFAGFAPVADPKVVCVIVVSEPDHYLHYGGHVCGPVFREVVKDALVHLDVPQDPMTEESLQTVMAAVQPSADADTVVSRVYELSPESAKAALSNMKLLPALEGLNIEGEGGLPNFVGMTRRQAKNRAASLGLAWDPQGAGRVTRQEPAPGTPLEQVQVCRFYFSRTGPIHASRQ